MPSRILPVSLPTAWEDNDFVESVRALVSSSQYAGIGVVLFVNQLDQIPKLIEDMELTDEQYSVRTGVANSALNALGREDHANAQVLLTTHKSFLICCAIARTSPKCRSSNSKVPRAA